MGSRSCWRTSSSPPTPFPDMRDLAVVVLVGCCGSILLGQAWAWITGSDRHRLLVGAAGAVAALQYYEMLR